MVLFVRTEQTPANFIPMMDLDAHGCPHVDVNPTGRSSFNWTPSEEEKLSAKGSLQPMSPQALGQTSSESKFIMWK